MTSSSLCDTLLESSYQHWGDDLRFHLSLRGLVRNCEIKLRKKSHNIQYEQIQRALHSSLFFSGFFYWHQNIPNCMFSRIHAVLQLIYKLTLQIWCILNELDTLIKMELSHNLCYWNRTTVSACSYCPGLTERTT